MDIHAGHRQRMYARFWKDGLDHFAPHEVLEVLLYFARPRIDTNELAHLLINRFGSISGVFDATKSELLKVPGVGEETATLLKMIPQLAKIYGTDQIKGKTITSPSELGEYVLPRFIGVKHEQVLVICLDSKNKIIAEPIVTEGSFTKAEININRIVSTALSTDAAGIAIAHNHPSGVALPSEGDIVTTRKLKQTLESVGICLFDHIIVADGDYVSMFLSHQI